MQMNSNQTDLPILMDFAVQYENEASEVFQTLKKIRLSAKKQGKNWKQLVLQPLQSGLQSLEEAIGLYDTCQITNKSILLCINFLQICALYRQSIDSNAFARKQQRFSFILTIVKKNIIPTPQSSEQEIGTYLTILKLYRGLKRLNDYQLLAQNLENVFCQNSHGSYKQLAFRQMLLTLYEDWISTIQQEQSFQQQEKQQKKYQVWMLLLKYQLEQPEPNYRCLYRISSKYFDFIYEQFAFLLLMDECDAASELLNYAIANQFDFVWLQLPALLWLLQHKKDAGDKKCKFSMEYTTRYCQTGSSMKFKIYKKLVNFK